MKATIAQLKKKVNALIRNTGTDLSKSNPYWLNNKHIHYMRDAINQVVADGESAPDKRLTPTEKQVASLNTWIYTLERKYLR